MNNLLLLMFLFVIGGGISLLVIISLTRRATKTLDQAKYRSRWLAITQNAGNTNGSWQFAIMSADKLLDSALRDKGVGGTTLGERLKNAKPYLSDINGVWQAHKLRNSIAHDDGVVVSQQQTNTALKVFKRALTDLGAL